MVVWPPLGQPFTPSTNAAASIGHAPLRLLRGFPYAAVQLAIERVGRGALVLIRGLDAIGVKQPGAVAVVLGQVVVAGQAALDVKRT